MDEKVCRHYFLSGRVQGVFFRAATEKTARGLGVSGWVRNLADGRVELLACGSEHQLRDLERWLWQGPPTARVEEVRIEESKPEHHTDFRVRG